MFQCILMELDETEDFILSRKDGVLFKVLPLKDEWLILCGSSRSITYAVVHVIPLVLLNTNTCTQHVILIKKKSNTQPSPVDIVFEDFESKEIN